MILKDFVNYISAIFYKSLFISYTFSLVTGHLIKADILKASYNMPATAVSLLNNYFESLREL